MAVTVKDKLNLANPNNLDAFLHKLYQASTGYGFGDILDAARPRPPRTRSSLTSSASQVHDVASTIVDIYVTAGTPLIKVYGAAAGAGEVRVEYNATTGIPTFTFGDGAVTEYSVVEIGPFPSNLDTTMTTEL